MAKEIDYLIFLRKYSVFNYLIAVGEQIALWHFSLHTFFWWALGLNILGSLGLALQIGKLEKKLGVSS